MPFFSFAFPKEFKKKFKVPYENFLENKHVLTTPFDIYSTLKDVLNLQSAETANLSRRSLSLFSKVCLRNFIAFSIDFFF